MVRRPQLPPTVRSRLPGVGWRDARIDELRGELAQARRDFVALSRSIDTTELERREKDETWVPPPSFRSHLIDLRRVMPTIRSVDTSGRHPLLGVTRKLANYTLAASHGVPVPEVYDVWRTPEQIDLGALPDRFVVKTDGGAGSHGVVPLRRVGPDAFVRVSGLGVVESAPLTTPDIRAWVTGRASLRAPYFAEEFLSQHAADATGIPDDVKIYAMHGEIGQVLLRRLAEHVRLKTMTSRYVDSSGADLGPDTLTGMRHDPAIPLPESFAEMLDIARHLSRAVGLPFVRVDLYDTTTGPVLGELTRTPGGRQRYRADHDVFLGRLWDEAIFRLDVDVMRGRPLRRLHGEQPARDYYAEAPGGRIRDRDLVAAPCRVWCTPS